jgi:hypothetical protein
VGMKEKSLEKEIADDRKWMLEQIEAMKDPAYVSELMVKPTCAPVAHALITLG